MSVDAVRLYSSPVQSSMGPSPPGYCGEGETHSRVFGQRWKSTLMQKLYIPVKLKRNKWDVVTTVQVWNNMLHTNQLVHQFRVSVNVPLGSVCYNKQCNMVHKSNTDIYTGGRKTNIENIT